MCADSIIDDSGRCDGGGWRAEPATVKRHGSNLVERKCAILLSTQSSRKQSADGLHSSSLIGLTTMEQAAHVAIKASSFSSSSETPHLAAPPKCPGKGQCSLSFSPKTLRSAWDLASTSADLGPNKRNEDGGEVDSDGVRMRGVDGAVDTLRACVRVDVRVVGVGVGVDSGTKDPAELAEAVVGV